MVMPSTTVKTFLGCDWGTTSFRLRLIAGGSRRVLAEQVEAAGVRHFAGLAPAARADRMAAYLEERIAHWTEVGPEVPFVVTGMASSTVGWRELPYADVPFALDGSNAVVSSLALPTRGGRRRPGLLVSGVRTRDDIMRGEESVLIGVQTLDAKLIDAPTPVLCLLAGTHPKHAVVRNGRLESFRTYLTGELFDVLSRDSILAASVRRLEGDAEPVWDEFHAGVLCAKTLGLSAALFQVRTQQVLKQVNPERNLWFLSGILVGDELNGVARNHGDTSLCLIGEAPRVSLYRAALRILAPQLRPENVREISITEANVAGQEQLLRRHAPLLNP
jgi:2-dehydro-3-deoxygalactonokinase